MSERYLKCVYLVHRFFSFHGLKINSSWPGLNRNDNIVLNLAMSTWWSWLLVKAESGSVCYSDICVYVWTFLFILKWKDFFCIDFFRSFILGLRLNQRFSKEWPMSYWEPFRAWFQGICDITTIFTITQTLFVLSTLMLSLKIVENQNNVLFLQIFFFALQNITIFFKMLLMLACNGLFNFKCINTLSVFSFIF